MNEWAEHRDPRRGSNPGPPRGPGQRRKRRPARQGLGLGSLGDGLKPLLLQVFRELLQDLLRGDLRSLISEAFGKPIGKADKRPSIPARGPAPPTAASPGKPDGKSARVEPPASWFKTPRPAPSTPVVEAAPKSGPSGGENWVTLTRRRPPPPPWELRPSDWEAPLIPFDMVACKLEAGAGPEPF